MRSRDEYIRWLKSASDRDYINMIMQGNRAMTKVNEVQSLLKQYNIIREANGLTPLKSWKGTAAELLARIKKSPVKASIAPTVVAQGAYASEQEAEAKTGHTTQGKTKRKQKEEERTRRFVDKVVDERTESGNTNRRRAASDKPATAKNATNKVADTSGSISLADIARELGLDPRKARAKARRYDDEFKALEVERHTYKAKDKSKVVALLKRDNRK